MTDNELRKEQEQLAALMDYYLTQDNLEMRQHMEEFPKINSTQICRYYVSGRCSGTREFEECWCNGDEFKCDISKSRCSND